jgi:hypothetical protein
VVIDGSFLTRTVEFISNHLEGHLVGLTLELPENSLSSRREIILEFLAHNWGVEPLGRHNGRFLF